MTTAVIALNRKGRIELARLARKINARGEDEVVANALSLYAYVTLQLAGRPARSLGFTIKINGKRTPETVILVPGFRR